MERRGEERGLFLLEVETRTVRVLRVLRRTCSLVRDVMVDKGRPRSWREIVDRGKKEKKRFAENEKMRRRVTTPSSDRADGRGEIIGHTRYR